MSGWMFRRGVGAWGRGGRDRDERGRQRKKIVRREDLRLETRNEPKSKKEKKPKTRRSKRIISSAIFPSLTIS